MAPDGRRAYVADWLTGEIAVYDTISNQLLATIRNANAYDLVMSPDGGRLFAAAGYSIGGVPAQVVQLLKGQP